MELYKLVSLVDRKILSTTSAARMTEEKMMRSIKARPNAKPHSETHRPPESHRHSAALESALALNFSTSMTKRS